LRVDEKNEKKVKSERMPDGFDAPGFGTPPMRCLEALNNAPTRVGESSFDVKIVRVHVMSTA
jgi:hypothetical protein